MIAATQRWRRPKFNCEVRLMRLRFLLLGILLTLSLSLFAQRVREAMTVEVVDVPVYVRHRGAPVQGLTRDDFELYVDGKRQQIDYFDVMSLAAESSLRERRLFLLLFDVSFSSPHSLARAQKGATRLINSSPKSDLFAVAKYSGKGVQIAVPFSDDRTALQRAIAELKTSSSGDPLAIVMTAAERSAAEAIYNAGRSDPNESLGPRWHDEMILSMYREIRLTKVRRRAEAQIEALGLLSERLASLDGQKHVVLLTEGFSTYFDHPQPYRVSSLDAPRTFESLTAIPPPTMFLANQLNGMARAFQRADVFLHAVDIETLPIYLSPTLDNSHYLLSAATGGRAMMNDNEVSSSLAEISSHFAQGYRLGFTPTNIRTGHNRIKVKLVNRRWGTSVTYRKGFAGTPQVTDVEDHLYLADVILNDVPQTGTAATLDVRDRTLRARVPLDALAAQLGEKGEAELLVYMFDATGTAVAFHDQIVQVPANASGERTYDIPLPAGATMVKALLRVDESIGVTKTKL